MQTNLENRIKALEQFRFLFFEKKEDFNAYNLCKLQLDYDNKAESAKIHSKSE